MWKFSYFPSTLVLRDFRRSKEPKAELTEEEVKKQIQETLARLSGGKKKNQSAKQRRTKRDEHARRAAEGRLRG